MKDNDINFYNRIKNVKKILYLDLGFLGDTIHQIPSLYCIRQAFPSAELHVMVAEHIMSIMSVTPWIDKVIGYPRFPKGPVWYKDIARVRKLRKECYDVIINLNGSDRSSLLTLGIGSPVRLGRTREKMPAFWPYCFTDTVTVPRGTMTIYRQSWECLKRLGFPGAEPMFNITIPQAVLQKVDAMLDNQRDFIHISPFTTQDCREVPIPILAEFINTIKRNYPKLKIVLSCAPNERECSRFKILLQLLNDEPWRAFQGTALPPLELAGLLSRGVLHIGGDSGVVHIAFMSGISTLSWFQQSKIAEWLPNGPKHHVVIGEATPNGLTGITSNDLVEVFQRAKMVW